MKPRKPSQSLAEARRRNVLGGLGFKETEPGDKAYRVVVVVQQLRSGNWSTIEDHPLTVSEDLEELRSYVRTLKEASHTPVLDAEAVVVWSCPQCHRDWPDDSHQAANQSCDECGYRERKPLYDEREDPGP